MAEKESNDGPISGSKIKNCITLIHSSWHKDRFQGTTSIVYLWRRVFRHSRLHRYSYSSRVGQAVRRHGLSKRSFVWQDVSSSCENWHTWHELCVLHQTFDIVIKRSIFFPCHIDSVGAAALHVRRDPFFFFGEQTKTWTFFVYAWN